MRSVKDTQAMLVRHSAALSQLGMNAEEMLLMVVAPSPAVEAASMQVVDDTDAFHEQAARLHGQGKSHHKSARTIRRHKQQQRASRVVALADLL